MTINQCLILSFFEFPDFDGGKNAGGIQEFNHDATPDFRSKYEKFGLCV